MITDAAAALELTLSDEELATPSLRDRLRKQKLFKTLFRT